MRKMVLAGLMSVLFPVAASASPVIVNGSFEEGIDPGSFTTLNNGSTAITGWTVGGLGIDYIGTYWEADDGVRSIDLSGNDKGSISQLLTDLIVGNTYGISFSLAGNPDGGASTKVAVVSDGGSQTSVFFFDQAGNTREDMGWVTQFFTFTAVDTSARLTFSATQNDPYGPAIDNVALVALPEPATWGLMILGFGAIGSVLRRRGARISYAS